MHSNMRQLLAGAAAVAAALILAVALWTGTALAQNGQPAVRGAGARQPVAAPQDGLQARLMMTGTAACASHGTQCGGGMADGTMRHGRMGRAMPGHGMARHGMMRHEMMRHEMMHHGMMHGAGMEPAAESSEPETISPETIVPEPVLPESFAAALETADAARGQQLTRANGCIGCHALDESMRTVGPTWDDLADTAARRVAGQGAVEYLYTSIVRPNAYVVPGYLPNVMVQSYGRQLGEQDLADIVKYLLALEE